MKQSTPQQHQQQQVYESGSRQILSQADPKIKRTQSINTRTIFSKQSQSSQVNINSPSSNNQITISFKQHQLLSSLNKPKRQIKSSNLSTAISSLTYGLSCLVYLPQTHQVYQCLMMLHEEYLNILHLIINHSTSYLLKLNDVKYITEQDTFISGKLASLSGLSQEIRENYIVLSLTTLKNVVLLFRTQHQRDLIFIGLKFFYNEGKLFYSKLSQFDPFKAESMMLFLQADKDGGNLLDIQEIMSILEQLKINKQKLDIQSDVLQVNKSLYQKQNMKRPKHASSYELTPIAFQYLLRYYSIKQELSKYFKEYCPMFKPKTKNHKNTIIDIIKNNQKPIMSSSQLKGFYRDILNDKNIGQVQLQDIINKFPVYDGQGKQKFDDFGQQKLLSFDNFCNLVFSRQNTLVQLDSRQMSMKKEQVSQDLLIRRQAINDKSQREYGDYSLIDYYIYTDNSYKNLKRKQKVNYFMMALKRGVKCLTLKLDISMISVTKSDKSKTANQKLNALVVRMDEKQREQLLLDDILNDIKSYAFERNSLPFFINLDIWEIFNQVNCMQYLELVNQLLEEILEKESIYTVPNSMGSSSKPYNLPSPNLLVNKFIILSSFNPKLPPKTFSVTPQTSKQSFQLPQSLNKKLILPAVKLDFQRKGQSCWNSCFVTQEKLKNLQSAQQQNIGNYSRKLVIVQLNDKASDDKKSDPFIGFRQGVQFVGQNFQKNKQQCYLIHSKFSQVSQNHFGYILKPQYMLSDNPASMYTNKDYTKQHSTRIKLTVLSGQKLILNQHLPFKQFQVCASMKGNVSDEQFNKEYKSQKKTQGFYTQIGLECEFVFYNEEMATILITVKNCQNQKILAGRAISLKNMRQGLRTVQLFGDKMQTKQNSYLLVHYTRKEIYQREDKANKMHQFLK